MERIIKDVYQDEDMTVKVESLDGVPFLHVYVDEFNKSILIRMREVFEELKAALLAYGWEQVFSYTQNRKFVKMFPGGEVINTIEHEGREYEVVKWELKA